MRKLISKIKLWVLRRIIDFGNDWWNILVMLRGPDVTNESIKFIFTGLARAFFSSFCRKFDECWHVTTEDIIYSLEKMQEDMEKTSNADQVYDAYLHYLNHAGKAVQSARRLGLISDDLATMLLTICDILYYYLLYMYHGEEIYLMKFIEHFEHLNKFNLGE